MRRYLITNETNPETVSGILTVPCGLALIYKTSPEVLYKILERDGTVQEGLFKIDETGFVLEEVT